MTRIKSLKYISKQTPYSFMVILTIVSLLLASCSTPDFVNRNKSVIDNRQFLGGVVADEPLAAMVGNGILEIGGSAADAAVALYFALSVTYPSNASLGSRGVCLLHDPKAREQQTKTRVINFLSPKRVLDNNVIESKLNNIPGVVMGMSMLHLSYGRMRWEQLVAPAEKMALFGHPISKALANDLLLAVKKGNLLENSSVKDIFTSKDGDLLLEGQVVQQRELAETLSQIRLKGPRGFYSGIVAQSLSRTIDVSNSSIVKKRMDTYRAHWESTDSAPFGNYLIHFPKMPIAGGTTAASIFKALEQDGAWENTSSEERPHLLIEANIRAVADRTKWLNGKINSNNLPGYSSKRMRDAMKTYNALQHQPLKQLNPKPSQFMENPAGTSFIVSDSFGLTIACVLSLSNLFGSGKMADGTGVFLPSMKMPASSIFMPHAPLIIVNPVSNSMIFTGTAIGGVSASGGLASIMLDVLLDNKPMMGALSNERFQHNVNPDVAIVESNVSQKSIESLKKRGHLVVPVDEIARVNAIYCNKGTPGKNVKCILGSDPRGLGITVYSSF